MSRTQTLAFGCTASAPSGQPSLLRREQKKRKHVGNTDFASDHTASACRREQPPLRPGQKKKKHAESNDSCIQPCRLCVQQNEISHPTRAEKEETCRKPTKIPARPDSSMRNCFLVDMSIIRLGTVLCTSPMPEEVLTLKSNDRRLLRELICFLVRQQQVGQWLQLKRLIVAVYVYVNNARIPTGCIHPGRMRLDSTMA
jgi:hypothetical protein